MQQVVGLVSELILRADFQCAMFKLAIFLKSLENLAQSNQIQVTRYKLIHYELGGLETQMNTEH